MSAAIEEARGGYQRIPDPRTTEFLDRYWALANTVVAGRVVLDDEQGMLQTMPLASQAETVRCPRALTRSVSALVLFPA